MAMEVLIMILVNKIRKFVLNKKVPISIAFCLLSETYGLSQVDFHIVI